jgi:hypothetical protein
MMHDRHKSFEMNILRRIWTLARAARPKVLILLIYVKNTVTRLNNTNLGKSWHERRYQSLPGDRRKGKVFLLSLTRYVFLHALDRFCNVVGPTNLLRPIAALLPGKCVHVRVIRRSRKSLCPHWGGCGGEGAERVGRWHREDQRFLSQGARWLDLQGSISAAGK